MKQLKEKPSLLIYIICHSSRNTITETKTELRTKGGNLFEKFKYQTNFITILKRVCLFQLFFRNLLQGSKCIKKSFAFSDCLSLQAHCLRIG